MPEIQPNTPEHLKRTCEYCGKAFAAHNATTIKNGGARFCSWKCSGAEHHQNLEERFWSKVDKNGPTIRPELGPCWIWTGSRTPWGYGQLSSDEQRPYHAHRLGWEIQVGKIPEGKQVLHKCDNPPCVRDSHLFLGDYADNMGDCARKLRTGRAVLTPEIVRSVRAEYPAATMRELAQKYGVTRTAIGYIIHRVNWKHVD